MLGEDVLGDDMPGDDMLGDELLELVPLPYEPLLAPAPLEELEVSELAGDALLPLEAPPLGQSAPTQFDELPDDEVPVVVELAPLPEAVLELGAVEGVVVVLAPVVVLPVPALLPLWAHAAASRAAATAAPMIFTFICLLLGG